MLVPPARTTGPVGVTNGGLDDMNCRWSGSSARSADHPRRRRARRRRADAELPRAVGAPAVDRAGGRDAAAVSKSRRDRGEHEAARHHDWRLAVLVGAVADGADLVLPPAPCGAGSRERAAVADEATGGDLPERDASGDARG